MHLNELKVCELRVRQCLSIDRCKEPYECLRCGWFKKYEDIIIIPRSRPKMTDLYPSRRSSMIGAN